MNSLKIILLLFLPLTLFSQEDYTWWNKKHNWDGITPWDEYIIYSPAYMGPNALPVPTIKDGRIKDELELELSLEEHYSKGDNTQNLFSKLYIPLAPKKVALELYVVPLEHFKMDSITRDKRRARDYDGEGWVGGDIYFGTIIQIFRDKEKLPDVTLSLNCKTASGFNLENARYTDAPGYFIDLSFGKKLSKEHSFFKHIKLYGVTGFYSWQTNSDRFPQNDAFLFGMGINFTNDKLTIDNSLGGYVGFIGNKDNPLVYRLDLIKKSKTFNYKLGYQLGLNDFEYQTFRFSIIFHIHTDKIGFLLP